MKFIALDLETANARMSSICQIGLAIFADGLLSDRFVSFVDPQDYFDGMNVAIHGIDEEAVAGAPTLPELYGTLRDYLTGKIVVSHTAFDRTAMHQAAEHLGLPPIQCSWLDSARVVRRTWPECAQSGYGLSAMAAKLGVKFNHHDAFEDARAAGEVLLRAIEASGIGLEEWLTKSLQRTGAPALVAREGNPDGPLYGEVVVFTGALSIPRHLAADAAARAGCSVGGGVTKDTTILVVGDQDISKLRPAETKSTKHRKAESLIAKGQPIRIIGETDFMVLCAVESA